MATTTGPNRTQEPSDHLRRLLDRLDERRKGAQWVMGVFAGVGAAMVLTVVDRLGAPSIFMGGVGFLLGAIVMVVAVGALDGHKASAAVGLRIAERLERVCRVLEGVQAGLAEVVRLEARLSRMAAELSDELARRRSG